MRLIKDLLVSVYYRLLFNRGLHNILRLYGKKVVDNFELTDPRNSYWIDCCQEHICPPCEVDEKRELYGTLDEQVRIVMKNWQYFPSSMHGHFLSLVKYIIWVRQARLANDKYSDYQENVSDHVYEM